MKFKILIFALFCSFSMVACTSNDQSTESLEKIEIQEMLSFSDHKPNTLQVISNEDDILTITNTIKRAKKMEGIVDIADPHYQLMMGKNSYYLWLNPDNTATIMNVADTNTIYRIYNAEMLINIIQP